MVTKYETTDVPWRVVQTQRHKERTAQARLEREHLQTYLPLLRQWPPPAVGSDIGPMFPGYVLVRAEPAHFHRIARTPGVHGLVSFGGEPARLDDAVVDFLRARAGIDGVVECDLLPLGAEVRITDGPLAGLVAVLDQRLTARQRVLVLLDLLQRKTKVELPAHWITPL